MVKKVWRTDGQTDGRTDRQTDWTSHIAAWSQLKIHIVLKHLKLTHSAMFTPARFSSPKPNNPYHSDIVSVSDVNLWSDGIYTVYPKKYAHGFCFAVLCCGYTLTDFPISIRLTSLALCQSNDCPSASKATLMNMDKYFMWIHYERLHNHNKAKHNKTVFIFLRIYCTYAGTVLTTK